MAEDRLTRTCDSCKASDSHAHHVQYVAGFIHPVTKENIDLSIHKHIQCCANDGCEICKTDVEFAADKSIGEAFNAHVQNKSDEHLQALTDRHGISTPISEPVVA
jgi:hypothetical protein